MFTKYLHLHLDGKRNKHFSTRQRRDLPAVSDPQHRAAARCMRSGGDDVERSFEEGVRPMTVWTLGVRAQPTPPQDATESKRDMVLTESSCFLKHEDVKLAAWNGECTCGLFV